MVNVLPSELMKEIQVQRVRIGERILVGDPAVGRKLLDIIKADLFRMPSLVTAPIATDVGNDACHPRRSGALVLELRELVKGSRDSPAPRPPRHLPHGGHLRGRDDSVSHGIARGRRRPRGDPGSAGRDEGGGPADHQAKRFPERRTVDQKIEVIKGDASVASFTSRPTLGGRREAPAPPRSPLSLMQTGANALQVPHPGDPRQGTCPREECHSGRMSTSSASTSRTPSPMRDILTNAVSVKTTLEVTS